MIDRESESNWKQHFPTYSFKYRDIALEEYKAAAKSLESEERLFLNASNIAVISGAGLGSLAVGALDPLTKAFSAVIPPEATLATLLFLTGTFAIVTVRYFADRQKCVVFAARKLIVLRRMLGLSYGHLQLILPNWRVEGADQPFAVRVFPGWNTYVTYPFYLIAGMSSFVILFVSSALAGRLVDRNWLFHVSSTTTGFSIAAAWAALLAYIYRKALLDTHERPIMLLARHVARIARLRLVGNFEYVIYRATLARYELTRLRVDLTNLKKVLVFIEDRTFCVHHGVSIRASARAILGIIGLKRRSGGSTITQQLVRTLFIEQPTKIVRRKLIELMLALWLDRVISKDDQLELYLASVRFERGVFGVAAAMKHFFGSVKRIPSKAEAFFLVERVSNIQSRLLADKIRLTLERALAAGVLSSEDSKEVFQLYERSVQQGLIRADGDALERLCRDVETA
jgi:penicillin-binding protein 1A